MVEEEYVVEVQVAKTTLKKDEKGKGRKLKFGGNNLKRKKGRRGRKRNFGRNNIKK